MSDNKQGISPFRDPSFLKSSTKTFRTDVSQQDIAEFRNAFSDDDTERTIPFDTKPKSSAPDTVPEDLYAEQSVDIDAFMESLMGSPLKTTDKKTKAAEASSEDDTATSERTKPFNLNDSFRRRINEIIPVPGEREKHIKENVRVLMKSKQSDRHILDKAPDEEAKTNIIDVIDAKKGEDIFDAVDKTVRKNSSLASAAVAAAIDRKDKREKKKRDQQALLAGQALRASLIRKNKAQKLRLILCTVMLFISLILSVLPSFYSQGNSLEFLFSDGGKLFSIINIVMLVPLAAMLFGNFKSAVKSFFSLSPNSDCGILIITLFVLIHNIATLVMASATAENARTYTCLAFFASSVKCFADYFKTRTALGSLNTVLRGKNLQCVQPIKNKKDANALANGLTDEEKLNILYCTDVEMGDSLTEGTGPRHSESKIYTYSSLAVLLSGFVLAAVSYVFTGSTVQFFTVLLSVICFCSPVTSECACAVLNYLENYKLNKAGAAATDNEGIHLVGKANAVAMDISDIFTSDVSSFRLMPGVIMKQNAAATVAAAVLIKANTLPGRCFEDFISQTGEKLPLTENVQYEEKLGFSAWVSGKRVLVGNREMLIQHSIPAPDEIEERHMSANKFVMYLVIEGRLIASFLVNYRALSSVKKLSDSFNKTGLLLILTCREPFLNHREIAKRLSLEAAAVKVLSGKSEAIINRYKSEKTDRISSGLVCSKAGHGLLNLVVSAYNLYIADKFLFNIHLLGQIMAFLLLILATVLKMPLFFSPFAIIVLELLWSSCSYAITSHKSK